MTSLTTLSTEGPYARIIARLDIKGADLVKGIHMEGLRVLGHPERFARHYYESGVDELIYMDAVASLYGRNSLLPIIERTARETFIPLTVAGGLRSIDDIRAVLRAGADKVSINTAAIANPYLIREAANVFGSSTITVGIEVVRGADGTYEAFTDFGREATGVDALEWAARAVDLGAGELMVTSIDREGTGTGFDLEVTRRIAEAVPVPVIASGGAGNVQHVYEVLTEGSADAVCLASLLHYNSVRYFKEHAEDHPEEEGNVEFLRGGGVTTMIRDAPLEEVRAHLVGKGVAIRQA